MEVIKRPAVVGHLAAPVTPAGRADQRPLGACACLERPLGEVHGPSRRATAVAPAGPVAPIAGKGVDHAPVPGEEHFPELRRSSF